MRRLPAVLAFLVPVFFLPGLVDSYHLPKITLARIAAVWLLAFTISRVLRHPDHSVPYPKSRLFYAAVAWTAVVFIAALGGTNPAGSFWGRDMYMFQGVVQQFTYLLIFYGAWWVSSEAISSVLAAFAWSAVPVCLYGLLQFLGLDPFNWKSEFGWRRVFSTMANPNFYGMYLAMVLPALLWRYLSSLRSPRSLAMTKGFWLAVLALTVFNLIACQTRGAWIAAAGSFAVFFLLTPSRFHRQLQPAVIATALSVFLSFGGMKLLGLLESRYAAPAAPATPADRLTSAASLSDPSAKARLMAWKIALRMWRDRPILGTGPEGFGFNFRKYMPAEFEKITKRNVVLEYPHNEYLSILAETGAVGALAYLWLLFELGLVIARSAGSRHCEEPQATKQSHAVPAVLAASIAGLLISNLFSYSTPTGAVLFWLFAGLALPRAPFSEETTPIPDGIRQTAWALTGLCLLPLLAEHFHYRARRRFQDGDISMAVRWMEKARRWMPFDRYYSETLAQMYLAEALQLNENEPDPVKKQARYQKAEQAAQRFIAFWPQSGLAHNLLGTIYAAGAQELQNRQIARYAAREFRIAGRDLDPNLFEAYANFAGISELAEGPEIALRIYRDFMKKWPEEALLHLNYGTFCFKYGNKALARKHWARAIALDPNGRHGGLARDRLQKLLSSLKADETIPKEGIP